MQIDVVTLFPEMFEAVQTTGMSRVAIERKAMQLTCYNPRAFATDQYRSIDDRPYGGGPGMVMMPQPLADCIDSIKGQNAGPVIYLSPQGERLNQEVVSELAALQQMVLLCGRYEGIDERVIDSRVDREISIGDYVLAGGELPAMVIIDAITRLLPGVLGNPMSARQDSFEGDVLDCPHYTRPEVFEQTAVPSVLLSGHHEKIKQWRESQSLLRTKQRRPDLLSRRQKDEQ